MSGVVLATVGLRCAGRTTSGERCRILTKLALYCTPTEFLATTTAALLEEAPSACYIHGGVRLARRITAEAARILEADR